MFCVYETAYFGDKLPTYYIGSSSLKRVKEEAYKGSVASKKYKDIWKLELRENPHLFSVRILSLHEIRHEALAEELRLQILFDVVKNPNFINSALAKPNGFFGSDTSGSNNGMYGKRFIHPNPVGKIGNGNRIHWTVNNENSSEILQKAAVKRSLTLRGRSKHNSDCVRKQAESHNKLSPLQRKQLIADRNSGKGWKEIHSQLIKEGIDIAYSSIRNIYLREIQQIPID